MFTKIDKTGDKKISVDEFSAAVPLMEQFGIKIDNPKKMFNEIDSTKSGTITFDEFCSFIIKISLD